MRLESCDGHLWSHFERMLHGADRKNRIAGKRERERERAINLHQVDISRYKIFEEHHLRMLGETLEEGDDTMRRLMETAKNESLSPVVCLTSFVLAGCRSGAPAVVLTLTSNFMEQRSQIRIPPLASADISGPLSYLVRLSSNSTIQIMSLLPVHHPPPLRSSSPRIDKIFD